ncbi:hypothetical protein NHX12_020543 [Muraenolepis orangiensis]|uniref:Uncharacterized protein n=1 Tax=Muraenolepis orangiensis TaxID=630683 RepID=A0A9Q0IT40_9TELE|nr:hypothetical protein NHX12_020543 [Muraenolepis orangiensis]
MCPVMTAPYLGPGNPPVPRTGEPTTVPRTGEPPRTSDQETPPYLGPGTPRTSDRGAPVPRTGNPPYLGPGNPPYLGPGNPPVPRTGGTPRVWKLLFCWSLEDSDLVVQEKVEGSDTCVSSAIFLPDFSSQHMTTGDQQEDQLMTITPVAHHTAGKQHFV